MKFKTYVKLIVFLVLINSINRLDLKSFDITTATKASLNFEILDAGLSSDSLTINGWAFINENQHYKTMTDHTIQLEFLSLTDSFVFTAELNGLNMTSAYEQLGLPYCAIGVYNSSTCNYTYEYVGFTVSIPLSRFKPGDKYSTNIIFLAHNSQTYLKTPLYYPISSTIQHQKGDYLYSILSKLDDTQFKIIETPIFARKSPGKAATIWTSGTNCSMTYGNRLYFKYGSIFTNILSRIVTENQTFYELNAKLDTCVDMRRRIAEGNTIIPVWISGMFVEYSGSPLEINSILINSSPVLTVENRIVSAKDQVNLLDYAKCFDNEEGDLSSKIIIESTDFINRAGAYLTTYYVEDKYGYFDRKSASITVIGDSNDPPIINATDKYINQYDVLDYLEGVTAHDLQDGDVTNQIRILNSIDTSQIVDQQLCFSVTDIDGAISNKCIVVHIYSNISSAGKFRFVSKNNLFYKDVVPQRWVGKEFHLQTMLTNNIILESLMIY